MLVLLVLACALDGTLKPVGDEPVGDEPAGDSDPPGDDTGDSDPGPDEPCDGLDNDGDGGHDEGWPDVDGDGTADCIDDACELDAGASVTPAPSACLEVEAPVPSVDPWNIVELWEFRDARGCKALSAGDFDRDGDVEILCTGTRIRVVDARTGELEESFGDADEIAYMGGSLAADVDGDGIWEILYLLDDGFAVSVSLDGTERWRSDTRVSTGVPWMETVALGDLEGDGRPVLIGPGGAVDAIDGSPGVPFASPQNPSEDCDQTIAVEDIDRDGWEDILYSWERRRSDGTAVWRTTPPEGWRYCVQPMVVQADEDPAGEVLWMSTNEPILVDTDGVVLRRWTIGDGDSAFGGQPCVADLDGDGWSDVVVPLGEEVVANTLGGHELWRAPMYDSTPHFGCTIANLDGVGPPELLMLDETTFRILDGATGAQLASYEAFHQATVNEMCLPLVVDDHTIVVCSLTAFDDDATTRIALAAFDTLAGDWSGGTRVWGASNWAGTQLREDGTVPARPASPWLVNGMYRGQPAVNATGIDLRVSVLDACAWSCDPTGVSVSLLVENAGPESLSDVPLVVYGYDAEGNRSTLRTMSANDVKPAGTSTVVTLDVTSSRPFTSIEAVVGEQDGALLPYECAEDDNRAAWVLPCAGGGG